MFHNQPYLHIMHQYDKEMAHNEAAGCCCNLEKWHSENQKP